MLKNENSYRLGEFIIIERSGVVLTWVTHIPFGCQRSGQCYLLGNILVILPWDHEEPGYLKLEFHEYLINLPRWTKTLYYCSASSLHQVGNSHGLTGEVIQQIASDKISYEIIKAGEQSSFRLGRYKITVNKNRIIIWQTIEGFNKTIGGTCFIESDILFLGPQEYVSDEERRRIFFTELKLLPHWVKTAAWGHAGSLKVCEDLKNSKSSHSATWATGATWNSAPKKIYIKDNLHLSQSEDFNETRFREIKESDLDWLKNLWARFVGWKVWAQLAKLATAFFFVSLRIIGFIVEKYNRRSAP